MKLQKHGESISQVEVTHVSMHGIWILMDEREFMLSYDDFPWFKNASIANIHNVVRKSESHLYWADLDVDLDTECIANPEKFPLVAKH